MLLYVSGPYSKGDVDANIEVAAEVAARLWERGHAVICPHTNTAHFDKRCTARYDQYIAGDLNIIDRCDALVILPGWEDSTGAVIERSHALALGIPVFEVPELPQLHPTEVTSPIQAAAFRQIVGRMYRVHLDKNADYSAANILGTGFIGLVTRLWDKMARLMNLTGFRLVLEQGEFSPPEVPKNESIEDTLLDEAVYSVIGIILRRGEWGR